MPRRSLFLFLVFSCLTNLAFGQKPLLTVGPQEITPEEFLYVYNKNKYYQDSLPPAESIERYMDLFINFKLKVVEAYSRGMDQSEDYQKEIAQYRRQLAEPYLTDQESTEALLQEAYQRMTQEVKVSHILIKIDNGDTAAAMTQINQIEGRISAGEDFNQLALEVSQDPSAQRNNGELGYFSVFRTIYPFESASSSSPVINITFTSARVR